MNQEKIGRFIAISRKKKNMTQKDLAERLNVTDRAVSNWENGKNMPDLSMFKVLCENLDITINDLLSGEKVDEEDYRKSFEENVTNMMLYSKKSKLKKKCVTCGILSVLLVIIIFSSLYFIDKRRMSREEPVLFSTWGEYYKPSYNFDIKFMERDMKRYIRKDMEKEVLYNGEVYNAVNVVNLHTFMIDDSKPEIVVYAWGMSGTHFEHNEDFGRVIDYSSKVSKPYVFTLKKLDFSYEVIDVKTVDIVDYEDNYYVIKNFIVNNFPKKVYSIVKDFYMNNEFTGFYFDYYELVSNYFG